MGKHDFKVNIPIPTSPSESELDAVASVVKTT